MYKQIFSNRWLIWTIAIMVGVTMFLWWTVQMTVIEINNTLVNRAFTKSRHKITEEALPGTSPVVSENPAVADGVN